MDESEKECRMKCWKENEFGVGGKNVASFDSLDDAIVTHMVSFISIKERKVVAGTCKMLLNAVEQHSAAALAEIVNQHPVDESFHDRIRWRCSQAKADSVIPQRCLLQAAHQVHLYRVNMFPSLSNPDLIAKISDDGKLLAVVGMRYFSVDVEDFTGEPICLCIWNLQNNASIVNLQIPTPYYESAIHGLYWMESHSKVAICANELLLVVDWKEAQVTLEHHFNHTATTSLKQDDSTVLIFNWKKELLLFDVISESHHTLTVKSDLGSSSVVHFRGISKNKRWLAVILDDGTHVLDLHQEGLDVCYRRNESIEKMDEMSNEVFAWNRRQGPSGENHHERKILEFDESTGNLSEIMTREHSFRKYPHWTWASPWCFVDDHKNDKGQHCLLVRKFKSKDDDLHRVILLPDFHVNAVSYVEADWRKNQFLSNGEEIFFVLERSDETFGAVIAAYLPDRGNYERVS